MTLTYAEIDAEYHRATQLGAARAIERLLRLPHLPAVRSWSIEAESGTVRGHLSLPDWSRHAAVAAVRTAHQAFGGTVRVRRRPDGARELCARFEAHLWPVELWAHTQRPDYLADQRANRQLHGQITRFTAYLARLGWFDDGAATMRRHTASGWWELTTSYGPTDEWLLFGPDGVPYGAFMASPSRSQARAAADDYIAKHEADQA